MRKALNQFIELFYFSFLRFIPLQTFKYGVCGGTTALTDLIVYFISYNFIFQKLPVHILGITIGPHIAAFLISFSVSFPMGFILNKFIVFTTSELRGRVQLFRYGMTVLASIALSYMFLKIFVEVFGIYPTVSKLLTTIIVTVFSYFSQQYFSFKVKSIKLKVPKSDEADYTRK